MGVAFECLRGQGSLVALFYWLIIAVKVHVVELLMRAAHDSVVSYRSSISEVP